MLWDYVLSFLILSYAVAEHLIAQHSAIKMLHSRVKLVLDYIKAVESGKILSDFVDLFIINLTISI